MGLGSAMGGFAQGLFGSPDDGIEGKTKKTVDLSGGAMSALTQGMEKYATTPNKPTASVGAFTGNSPDAVGNRSLTTDDSNYASTFGINDQELLNSIATNEGTYNTGYDTEYAYGKYGGGRTRKLSDMTVDEVMAHQQTMLGNQKGNSLRSTAIGRYQMLNRTLREEARMAGIDTATAKFNGELQDKLIMQRLSRARGLDKWRAGEMSTKDFKKNLSREFASINDPYTGKGHYSGQGAKDVDLRKAMGMLDESKGEEQEIYRQPNGDVVDFRPTMENYNKQKPSSYKPKVIGNKPNRRKKFNEAMQKGMMEGNALYDLESMYYDEGVKKAVEAMMK